MSPIMNVTQVQTKEQSLETLNKKTTHQKKEPMLEWQEMKLLLN